MRLFDVAEDERVVSVARLADDGQANGNGETNGNGATNGAGEVNGDGGDSSVVRRPVAED